MVATGKLFHRFSKRFEGRKAPAQVIVEEGMVEDISLLQ
jgi:hypothetical protein